MLGEQIKAIYRQSRGTYGSPRITEALRDRGIRCSRKRAARIMRQKGLRGVQKARFSRDRFRLFRTDRRRS